MTREQKEQAELLFKDLCGRLPYGVKVQSHRYGEDDVETIETLYEIDSDGYMSTLECETLVPISKPYLFPIASMTDEQEEKYNNLNCYELGCFPHTEEALDYLIRNHFDYRNLIPVGLALDATGLNIY
jgi:hypothetical protein